VIHFAELRSRLFLAAGSRSTSRIDSELLNEALVAIEALVRERDDAIAARDGLKARVAELEAKLAAWQDPESPERLALDEQILFNLGEGSRSEVELREGQIAQTEAALHLCRARVAELDALIRERCGHICAPLGHFRSGTKRHAPECLVEDAGL